MRLEVSLLAYAEERFVHPRRSLGHAIVVPGDHAPHGLVRLVRQVQQVDVPGRDEAVVEHLLAEPVEELAPVMVRSKSTTGKLPIFPVWISVSASQSSSCVPKPPGKMTNPSAAFTNITLRA